IGAVAMSVSLDGLRKVRRRAAREAPLEEGHQVAASTDRPRDADLKDRLYRAIDELADGYRAVFVLHELEGYSHEEIAEMLHVTPGTSKAQLHRARARLRESLAAFV
ncbi:MAG TPA: sigma-70 family RNA polymerase sigma factor, partial [Gemmatimonadales bacterium]|nr:sigma-70 family RNA polymerase sigma factor [Gemmatimonadales bacterium]